MRLVVTNEFVTELEKTTTEKVTDPILQMARRLPRLPMVAAQELSRLRDQIHDLVFIRTGGATTPQSLSDAMHLAHSALCRASLFITSDKQILAARNKLLSEVGQDVASLGELIALLPHPSEAKPSSPIHGEEFELKTPSIEELSQYLLVAGVPSSVVSEFCVPRSDERVHLEAIFKNTEIVAVGALFVPEAMEPKARLLIHARPEHVDCEVFADHLMDNLTRRACCDLPITIELIHLTGQSLVSSLALARGFVRAGPLNNCVKVAIGRPVTRKTWPTVAAQIRRRTGFDLPSDIKLLTGAIPLTRPDGQRFHLSKSELEDFFSPTIITWNGRDGVIVPITRAYATELLGTGDQLTLSFIKRRDAAFFSRRAYVNTPRSSSLMRPDVPILFYESLNSGGQGAVVAIARIVDAVVIGKLDVPSESLKRLVVDNVADFSTTDDVLLTTFENSFVMPKSVPLQKLREFGAVSGANLVTAQAISNRNISAIVEAGWAT